MSGGHRLLFAVVGPAERDHRNDRTDKGDHGDDRCDGQHGAKNSRTFPQRGSMSLGGFLFFARGLQFGLLALLLGLDAVVFTPPGSLQEVAGGVEAVAETGFGGQGFGFGQPGAFQQPGFVAGRWRASRRRRARGCRRL